MAKHRLDEHHSDEMIYAAGGILFRDGDSGIEIGVIHRPRYDDWSFPKGKVDHEELIPVTAIREIAEETGYRSYLGQFLGVVSYPLAQGIKHISYWQAHALEGQFVANDEVDQMQWVSIDQAHDLLTYPYDRHILECFSRQCHTSSSLLVVRHARAGQRGEFHGNDDLRPLDKKGRRQAQALVGQLCAFGADRIYAAERLRCIQTVEPLAEHLNVTIEIQPWLTEEFYTYHPEQVHHHFLEIAQQGGNPVICSQGGLIPEVIKWWSRRDQVPVEQITSRKASTWVLSCHKTQLLAAQYLDNPLDYVH